MKKEEKRLKILKAATECFAKYGYDKTTLEDIGKAIGLNKASLYYYYKNKEGIYCDVILQDAAIYMRDLQKKVKSSKTYEARILNYMTERFAYYKRVINLHNLSMDTIRKVSPIYVEVYDMVLEKESEFLTEVLKAGQESGEFGKFDAQRTARVLLEIATAIRYKAMNTCCEKSFEEKDDEKIIEDVRFACKLILKGLRACLD